MALLKKGHKVSEETCKKMSIGHLGKKQLQKVIDKRMKTVKERYGRSLTTPKDSVKKTKL